MPVTRDSPAPYAPSGVILSLLDRYRERGLPVPITAEVLTRAGVSDSLNSRTLQALQTLDLIDDAGQPTPTLERLRLAPESEYKARIGEWLSSAYADALSFINLTTATDTEIRDAFRSYKPFGQQDRMVTLFIGLHEAAGLMPERARKTRQKQKNGNTQRSQPQPRANLQPSVEPQSAVSPPHHGQRKDHVGVELHPALSGLLQSLPQQGEGWSKAQRDLFVQTFGAVLDFCYPVTSG